MAPKKKSMFLDELPLYNTEIIQQRVNLDGCFMGVSISGFNRFFPHETILH